MGVNKLVGKGIVTVLAALAPVLVTVFYAAFRHRVPDPLPTHWRGASTVDGTAGAGTLAVVCVIVAAVLALVTVGIIWLRHSDMAGRLAACGLMFGAWLPPAVYGQIVISSSGAQRAEQVTLPWYAVLLTVLVPVVVGAMCWWLLPASWQASDVRPASTIRLGATERITWVGRAQSAAIRWFAAGGVVVAGLLLPFFLWAAVVVFAVGVLLLFVGELVVRVDASGLHTLWGPFGWPRSTIPLTSIVAAHAETIEPMRWGGWGLRVTGRGVAAVVRKGPGLVVDRATGPRYAVTVDGAERGADVLNALLVRAGGRNTEG